MIRMSSLSQASSITGGLMLADVRLMTGMEYRETWAGSWSEFRADQSHREGWGLSSISGLLACDILMQTEDWRMQHGPGYRAHPCPRMGRCPTWT